jgi:hypothetical protein
LDEINYGGHPFKKHLSREKSILSEFGGGMEPRVVLLWSLEGQDGDVSHANLINGINLYVK